MPGIQAINTRTPASAKRGRIERVVAEAMAAVVVVASRVSDLQGADSSWLMAEAVVALMAALLVPAQLRMKLRRGHQHAVTATPSRTLGAVLLMGASIPPTDNHTQQWLWGSAA